MERLIISLALLCPLMAAAQQFQVNIDEKTFGQIVLNTGMQTAAESLTNQQMDTISNKKKIIAEMKEAIALAKKVEEYAKQNIEGFGTESIFYKQICKYAEEIVVSSPKVIEDVAKAKMPGRVNALLQVGKLYTNAVTLVNDFCNIVTNAKVKNPFKSEGNEKATEAKSDGHNLLDRRERLNLTITITKDLYAVVLKLRSIHYLALYSGWMDVMHELDLDTWRSVLYGKAVSGRIIDKWKKL